MNREYIKKITEAYGEVVKYKKTLLDESVQDDQEDVPATTLVSIYRKMWESKDKHKKNATKSEKLLDNESPKSKEFVDLHKIVIDDTDEKGHDDASKAGRVTKAAKQPKGKGVSEESEVQEGLRKGEREATKANQANPAVARYRDKTRSGRSGYQFTSFHHTDPKIGELKAQHKGTGNRVRVRPRLADKGVERNQNSDAKMKDGHRFDVYVHPKKGGNDSGPAYKEMKRKAFKGHLRTDGKIQD